MEKTDKVQSDQNRWNAFLYLCVAIVNLASFSIGTIFAWSSPAIPKLNGKSDPASNPLPSNLTAEEESWVISLLALGATIGPLIACIFVDRIGRKKTLILSVVLLLLSFTMKSFATNVWTFYCARFIGGISTGSILTVVPIYVGEIAEIHNRGRLGCVLAIFISLGQLFSFSLGPYIHVQYFSAFCLIFPTLFLVTFTFLVPESPYYLAGRNQQNEAKQSLLKLRFGNTSLAEEELAEITKTLKQSQISQTSLKDILENRSYSKGLLVCVGLMTFQQLTGVTVIIFYMQTIFMNSGSSISSEFSTISVAIIQLIGCSFASILVEKLGRKLLLLVSAFSVSLTLSILATYFYLKKTGVDIEMLFWLPITCVIVYIAAFNVGYGPIPFTILGEIFPPNVKSFASTLAMCVGLLLAFCTTKFFPNLVDLIGNHYSFWVFSGCTLLSVGFIYLFLPETKGKNLQEILDKLDGKAK